MKWTLPLMDGCNLDGGAVAMLRNVKILFIWHGWSWIKATMFFLQERVPKNFPNHIRWN
ncbi:MAG: hypothetical protein IPI30_21580 [Saprospiraceae bacterium]|nr:hypothetical protein [Candidatus Vicinibacter affinis]